MKTKSCLFSLVHKAVAVVIILFLNISCGENTFTETETIISDRTPGDPFYTGTIRLTQMPTSANPDRDLIIDMNVTFKPDSNGYWPALYNQQVNTVKVTYFSLIFYSDSLFFSNVPQDKLLQMSETQTIDSLSLPPTISQLPIEVTRSYKFEIPAYIFSQYPQTSNLSKLHIRLDIRFIGKIESTNSLNGLTYPCFEVIEYELATGKLYHRSWYNDIESPFTIIP